MKTIVHMIWIGDYSQSVQECIDSFALYHEVHLWSYTPQTFANCVLCDANEIHPEADLHENLDRIPSITDWLRINLIYQLGGWYSDCDNYCIAELDIPFENVFTYFTGSSGDLNNSIFKCEKGSSILKALIDSYSFDPDRAAYLEFSDKCLGKSAYYLDSNFLHFKMKDLDSLDTSLTKVVHLFSARKETANLKLINQLKTKIDGRS